MSDNSSQPPRDPPGPAPNHRKAYVYFSDNMRLRERILAWDPKTERRGTIEALAKRIENTAKSQDWENTSPGLRDREEPRRKVYRYMKLSKRTLERALKGENVTVVSATIIVSELGSTFDELGVVPVQEEHEPLLPDPTSIGIVMELATQIAFDWLTHGKDVHPDPSLGEHGMPAHPEFHYRLSGQWEGWNDFLGVEANAPQAAMHQRLDAIEDSLFDLIGMVLNLSGTGRGGTDMDEQ